MENALCKSCVQKGVVEIAWWDVMCAAQWKKVVVELVWWKM